MKKKTTITILGLLILSSILITPLITARYIKKIEIGVITSGSEAYENTLSLFEEIIEPDINDYVRKLSRQRFLPNIRFDFIVEHADTNPDTHLEKVEMFHEQGIDLIIGGYWSSQVQGSLVYVNDNDMLLLSPSSTAPVLSIPDDNLFRLAPSDPSQGIVTAKMLISKGIDEVIVIYRDDVWGNGVYDSFVPEFEDMGGTLIGAYSYATDETDFTAILNDAEEDAVGASNPGILLISFAEVKDIITQASDGSYPTIYEPPWFGCEGAGRSMTTLSEGPDQAVYLKIYSALSAPPNSPQFNEFAERYESVTGNEPSYYTANEFDAAWLIAQAVLETRPSAVGKRSKLYDATSVIEIIPDIASRYYGYSGNCLLNEAGDRIPGLYDIWGYYMDNNAPDYKKYGRYDNLIDEVFWYP